MDIDWKRVARGELRDYPLKKVACENIPTKISELEQEATAIRSATADGTPVQGGGNAREDRLISNIVARKRLSCNLEAARLFCQAMERAFSVLGRDDVVCLEKMYVYREAGALQRLQDEFGYSDTRSVYKRVDIALRNYIIAAYGITVL